MSSAGASILGVGYLIPLIYFIWSMRYGPFAGPNPWDAQRPGMDDTPPRHPPTTSIQAAGVGTGLCLRAGGTEGWLSHHSAPWHITLMIREQQIEASHLGHVGVSGHRDYFLWRPVRRVHRSIAWPIRRRLAQPVITWTSCSALSIRRC